MTRLLVLDVDQPKGEGNTAPSGRTGTEGEGTNGTPADAATASATAFEGGEQPAPAPRAAAAPGVASLSEMAADAIGGRLRVRERWPADGADVLARYRNALVDAQHESGKARANAVWDADWLARVIRADVAALLDAYDQERAAHAVTAAALERAGVRVREAEADAAEWKAAATRASTLFVRRATGGEGAP
jgi:hypothetical protein